MELTAVPIIKPETASVILGQSHFIKTVEDIHEAMVNSVPGIRFGVAFCEASGARLVRVSGTDEEMQRLAIENALAIGAGHSFVLMLAEGFTRSTCSAPSCGPGSSRHLLRERESCRSDRGADRCRLQDHRRGRRRAPLGVEDDEGSVAQGSPAHDRLQAVVPVAVLMRSPCLVAHPQWAMSG